MDSMSEQAAQAARASRSTLWRLDERLSAGEIALPETIPIRMWIFTMKHVTQGHMGYDEFHKEVRRDNRYTRYEAVRTLYEQGFNKSEISRRLGLCRETITRF